MIDSAQEAARQLANDHLAKEWQTEGSRSNLKLFRHENLPDSGHAVDDRHRTESGWFYFFVVFDNLKDADHHVCVHPASGEIRVPSFD